MYPSKYSFSWNAMDVGPKRDLLGELAAAVRNGSDMHFGIYHSLFDWFHPLYKKDKESGFKTQDFVKSKALPELYELVMEYHPEVVWSDGDWEAPDQYWNSTGFLAWLYNESPVKDIVVTNDRWGQGCPCKHGGYYSCADRFNPGTLQKHKWESCTTIDRESWGYRREARFADFYSIEEILKMLVGVVSCGGNLLLNVGPTSYGKISPIFEERLHQMGEWLKVNGEAIYKTRPWPKAQNDTLSSFVWYGLISQYLTKSSVMYTQGKSSPAVYAIALEWPDNEVLHLGAPKPTETTEVYMLGYDKPLRWKSVKDGMVVDFPNMSRVSSKWSWVLKLLDVA
ncbi:unnamed protein product [Darwinula stevensoni]|uniref:alpha-L-fucosidase n=1 Tax=Darwinula stevensoni TaxID=69355 RepID=A0A7R9A680_9CRUS|nr:unnamed protein product [Darwinula stevensoni]CAG0886970.1 unnamed protein product [Darwinula stevensoni]